MIRSPDLHQLHTMYWTQFVPRDNVLVHMAELQRTHIADSVRIECMWGTSYGKGAQRTRVAARVLDIALSRRFRSDE